MRVDINAGSTQGSHVGFSNAGYWGIDVKNHTYKASFYVKGQYSGIFTIGLKSATNGQVLASTKIAANMTTGKWTRFTADITPTTVAVDVNNVFTLTFDPKGLKGGSLWFNLISLFPPTFKNV